MKVVQNPPSPFLSADKIYFEGMTPPAELTVYEDATRSILSHNDSPDLPYRWSLNPYRGCTHGCSYCYARPSHEYLDFGAGTDFETKIVIKKTAPELLRETFMKRSWKGESILFSGDTDAYQPLEATYQITRRCLEVCLEFGNPVKIITKSFLIVRDLELLKALHKRTHLFVTISIPFWDEKVARVVEPGAASVSKRFEALEILSRNGIQTSVNIAPVIPGLSETDIPRILKKTKACGAVSANMLVLRLPGSVKEVFLNRIKGSFPLAYDKILHRILEMRNGKLYQSGFGQRFRGEGNYWKQIEEMFDVYYKKLGFKGRGELPPRPPFSRPTPQSEFVFS